MPDEGSARAERGRELAWAGAVTRRRGRHGRDPRPRRRLERAPTTPSRSRRRRSRPGVWAEAVRAARERPALEARRRGHDAVGPSRASDLETEQREPLVPPTRRIRTSCTCPDREYASRVQARRGARVRRRRRDRPRPVAPPALARLRARRAAGIAQRRPVARRRRSRRRARCARCRPAPSSSGSAGAASASADATSPRRSSPPTARSRAAGRPSRPGMIERVEQRLSLVTLGVADLDAARRFYEALGWSRSGDRRGRRLLPGRRHGRRAVEPGGARRGQRRRGQRRLGRRDARAQRPLAGRGRRGDRGGAGRRARRIAREPAETFWGGYSGVFLDPDGHPWEVAHNPGWTLTADGSVAALSQGYSGTPLPRKLGIAEGGTFAVVGDPGHVDELLSPLPAGARRVEARPRPTSSSSSRPSAASSSARSSALGAAIFPDRMLWIAWPKRASKVPTDVTEDVVREVALPLGPRRHEGRRDRRDVVGPAARVAPRAARR